MNQEPMKIKTEEELDRLRSERIDELIKECDRIDRELAQMRRDRMTVNPVDLLAKYDELAKTKKLLAQLQLDQIDRFSIESRTD